MEQTRNAQSKNDYICNVLSAFLDIAGKGIQGQSVAFFYANDVELYTLNSEDAELPPEDALAVEGAAHNSEEKFLYGSDWNTLSVGMT